MPYYTYRDYVYINNEYDEPEEHHIKSILKTQPDIYITSLSKLVDESLQDFPELFVDRMIKTYIFEYVKVVSQLSNFVKWNKESDDMESIVIAREERENIISYVDYSKIFHVVRSFPDLNQKIGKEDITFTVYSSSIAIEWQKKYLNGLDQFVDQIDTSLYEDFRINLKSINDPNIYNLGCKMRDTCNKIHRKKLNS